MINAVKLYLLIVCGLIIWLFTDEFSGRNIGLAIGMVALPVFALIVAGLFRGLQERYKPEAEVRFVYPDIEKFKRRATKIVVPLLQCEVVTNTYQEEFLHSDDHRIQALDSLYGDGDANIARVQTNQSVIVYATKIAGMERTFRSPVLPFERITLLFKLDLQKETALYYLSENPDEYYFDLEFLNYRS